MQEAIILDADTKSKYDYAYFPGMCPCIGVIIKSKEDPNHIGLIHYLGGTNPDSVLSFIKKYFAAKSLDIITFAGNAPTEFDIPKEFPDISIEGPDIKSNKLPKLESTGFMSDEDYYNVALQNRYEFNYILKALNSSGHIVNHIHDSSVIYRDNVFFDFKTNNISTNLNVNVIRDDYTEEDGKNPFFLKDNVFKDNISGRLFKQWNGNNIVVSDKRSWLQYSSDILTSAISSIGYKY